MPHFFYERTLTEKTFDYSLSKNLTPKFFGDTMGATEIVQRTYLTILKLKTQLSDFATLYSQEHVF